MTWSRAITNPLKIRKQEAGMREIIENGPFYIRIVIVLAILIFVIRKVTALHDVVLPAIGM